MSPPAARAPGADASLELIFANAPIGMALVAPDGSWLRVNPALCELLGRSEEQLLALTFQDLTHPDDLDSDLGLLARVARGELERYRMEKRYLRPDGDIVAADLSVSVVRDADGAPAYYISQIVDVTDRRRMEATVARREREYRMIAEQSTDMLSRHAADGTFLFASAASWRILGLEPEALLGRGYTELVHPDDLPQLQRAWRTLGVDADVVRLEGRLLRQDGSAVWAEISVTAIRDADGEIHELQCGTRDVTDRRRQEARHRAVVETMAEGVVLLDTAGRVLDANAAACRMLDRAEADLVGRLDTQIPLELVDAGGDPLPPGRLPCVAAALAGTPSADLVLGAERADGERRWATLSARPIADGGAVAGVVLSLADITELVRAQDAAASRAVELERSNHQLERFAYVASHDLSEPLRVMAAYAGMLERRYSGALDERGRRYAGNITAGAERLRQLIDGLLAFSRVRSRRLEVERFDAGAALQEVLGDLSRALSDAGATVTWDGLAEIEADRARFRQVLQNLVANAIKFRAPGRAPEVHVGVDASPRAWAFTVRDNGIGIAPDYHERIFELFRRLHTTEEHPGTGLGLAICKEVVDAHGGHLSVESTPGAGAAFTFTIPRRSGSGAALVH
jgi:PAS domain S-box-containing protein